MVGKRKLEKKVDDVPPVPTRFPPRIAGPRKKGCRSRFPGSRDRDAVSPDSFNRKEKAMPA